MGEIPLQIELFSGELIDSRADLKDRLELLKDTDIESIALEAEGALLAVYTMVLNITLTNYLTREKEPTVLCQSPDTAFRGLKPTFL